MRRIAPNSKQLTANSPQPHGVAIVMVIAILAGLMALVAPFLFSMALQGRAVRSDVHAMYARQAAQGAIAHGIAQLYGTLRLDPKDDSPETTSLADIRIPIEFPSNPEFDKLNTNYTNPNGSLWSLRIEDEQGKANVNSAPPALIGNLLGSGITTEKSVKGDTTLTVDDASWCYGFDPDDRVQGTVCIEGETLRYKGARGGTIQLADALQHGHSSGALVYDGRARKIADWPYALGHQPFASIYELKSACAGVGLAPDEFARLERMVTTCSGLDGSQWGTSAQPTSQQSPVQQQGVVIQGPGGFGPETLYRVGQGSDTQAYGRVVHSHLNPDNTLTLQLDGAAGLNPVSQTTNPLNVQNAQNGAQNNAVSIQPLLEHPININTAPREVLVACFKGLCLEGSDHAITRQIAEGMADYLISKKQVFATREDLIKVFEQARKALNLSFAERDACLINATEARSPKLRTETVPFCFHSWGSYTVEGAGVENADNGTQYARNVLRQVVTLPTPYPGRFKVQYQSGFQDLVDQGLTHYLVTFRDPVAKYRTMRDQPEHFLPNAADGNIRLDVGASGTFGLPGEFYDPCNDPTNPGYRQDGYDMQICNPWVLVPINNGTGGPPPGPVVQQNPNQAAGAQAPPVQGVAVAGPGAANAAPPPVITVACVPTSVEAWVRPLRDSSFVIYEEGLEEERNRVTFSYQPQHRPANGLVVSIYDAGLECKDAANGGFNHLKRNPVEYIYPIELLPNDWWHVAASWKTSQPNGQEIRVDAQPFPDPRDGVAVNRPGTKLASDVGLDEVDSISLEDADKSDFPLSGAVKVGEEIIEYQVRNGTTLTTLTRGARLSAQAKHNQGELVMPYGYSNSLAQNLRVGGATLSADLAAANVTHCRVAIPPGQKQRFVLDSDTSKIPVDDATNFPQTGGYIMCEGEALYYDNRTATSLNKLTRAYKGPARNLHDGSGITLASIQISNAAQYDQDGIVQIDNESNNKQVEWIRHNVIQITNGKNFLVGLIGDGNPQGHIRTGAMDTQAAGFASQWGLWDFRNKFGIGGVNMAHSKGTKVIPVVQMSGPHCGNQASPYGDTGVSEVSVIQKGTVDGDLRYVKQAYINQYPNFNGQPCPQTQFTGWGFQFYVGLNDFVSRDYPAGSTRFLKWPSGELPDAVNAQRHVMSDRNMEGRIPGHVDEVIVDTHNTTGGRVAINTEPQDMNTNDDTVNIEPFDAWPQNGNVNAQMNWPQAGGLIRIEDELMFYKTASTGQISFYADVLPYVSGKQFMTKSTRSVTYCGRTEEHPNIHQRNVMQLGGLIRGLFGSTAAKHPPGAPVMLLDGMAVTTLTQTLTDQSDQFSVKNSAGFPLEGYALIGNQRTNGEVVSWTSGGGAAGGAAPVGAGLAVAAGGGGTLSGCHAFRGRYGTSQQDHEVDELVRCLPFRYWDRDVQMYDGIGQAYMETGYAAEGAIWDGIELKLTGTDEQPLPGGVRPHILVRYNHKPAWETEPSNQDGGIYEFKSTGEWTPLSGIHADNIDVRIYWNFRRGTFQPGLDWKRTFSIEKLRVRYTTPLIMRRLDELEKR